MMKRGDEDDRPNSYEWVCYATTGDEPYVIEPLRVDAQCEYCRRISRYPATVCDGCGAVLPARGRDYR